MSRDQASESQLNCRKYIHPLALLAGVSKINRNPTGLFGSYGSTAGAQNINGGRKRLKRVAD